MSVTSRPASVDARGRAIPLSEDELCRRAEEAIRALDDIGTEEEQRETLAFLMTAVDEDRLSDRKRFRACD